MIDTMRHVKYVLPRHICTAAMLMFTEHVCIAESATTAILADENFGQYRK